MPTWNEILVWGVPIVVGVVGVAWLAWALVSDRARGRLRCPTCWYDMSGVDASGGATCPECGRVVKRAKALRRTRRRRRQAFVAAALVAGAYPAHVALLASQVGWAKALPSSVLVFAAPMEDPATWVASKPTDPLFEELLDRGKARELTTWQWRVLFRRLEREMPRAMAWDEVVQTRPVWARDSEAAVLINGGASPIAFVLGLDELDIALHARIVGSEHPGYDGFWGAWLPVSLGAPRGDVGQIELRVLWLPNADPSNPREIFRSRSAETETLWRGEVASFDVVESATEILEPRESEEVGAWFEALTLSGDEESGHYARGYFGGWGAHNDDADLAVGVEVRLLREGALVATGDLVFPLPFPFGNTSDPQWIVIAPLDWIDGPRPLDLEDASWRIRVTGRASIALRQLFSIGSYPTQFWSGEIEVDARMWQPDPQ